LLNVRPGIEPRFLSQKIGVNDPLKKIPSTTANAMRPETQRIAQLTSMGKEYMLGLPR